jgi:thymidylate synthase (FAD)
MKVEILTHTPNPEILIAKCASTCYDSIPKELEPARKMIKAIIKSGHESCIEHASVTFEIDGVSRVVTHELVRHRIGFSYS